MSSFSVYEAWLGALAGTVVPVGFLVAAAVLIARDSKARGRSGFGWLIACTLLLPLAIPAFVVLAVIDRFRGRLGIESRWSPAGRWYLLGGVVLALSAAALVLTPMHVSSLSVSAPGVSGSFSGSCSSALAESLGVGEYRQDPFASDDASPVLAAARATIARRCSAASATRMEASAICLSGALLLVAAGQGMNRRRRSRASQPSMG
jgi:hypothetical protein